jgi:hypothetical protein
VIRRIELEIEMRFTIRDAMLTTAIVAIAIGWWLDRSALDEQRAKAEDSAETARLVLDELMKTFDGIHPGWRKSKWAEIEVESRKSKQ